MSNHLCSWTKREGVLGEERSRPSRRFGEDLGGCERKSTDGAMIFDVRMHLS